MRMGTLTRMLMTKGFLLPDEDDGFAINIRIRINISIKHHASGRRPIGRK